MAPLPATYIWIRNGPLHLGPTLVGPTLGPTHFTKTINDQGTFRKGIFTVEYLATNSGILRIFDAEEPRFNMRAGETLKSLHAQPRGSQADTSAVAIAEHCSFIDDLSSERVALQPHLV